MGCWHLGEVGPAWLGLTRGAPLVRAFPNASQGPPSNIPASPSKPSGTGRAGNRECLGWGGVGFLPKLPPPPPPPPGAGYVAQEGHSWAKYNLGWAAVPGRDAEGGHSPASARDELPVPASGRDPHWPWPGTGHLRPRRSISF